MLEGIAQENRSLAQRADHPTRHSEAETVSVRALIASTYFSYSQKMCNYPANLRSNSPQPRIVGPLSSMRILSISGKKRLEKVYGELVGKSRKIGQIRAFVMACYEKVAGACHAERPRSIWSHQAGGVAHADASRSLSMTRPRTFLTSDRRTTVEYSMIEVDVVSV